MKFGLKEMALVFMLIYFVAFSIGYIKYTMHMNKKRNEINERR